MPKILKKVKIHGLEKTSSHFKGDLFGIAATTRFFFRVVRWCHALPFGGREFKAPRSLPIFFV